MSRPCRILFWNVNRKSLGNLVCEIARDTDADVIVLNESSDTPARLISQLRQQVDPNFFEPSPIGPGRFQCFSRRTSLDLSELHKFDRMSLRRFSVGSTTILLGLIHGLDIRNHDSAHRMANIQIMAEQVRFFSSQNGIAAVMLLGDFNMNPYDQAMNLPMGMNAMMTRACTKRGTRTFQKKHYDFFYNPMWSLFGDLSNGPAGTFYDRSAQGPYGWSMLDQVLIHYSIVGLFESVRIITSAGATRLIDSKGRPSAKVASDHLPILTVLNEV